MLRLLLISAILWLCASAALPTCQPSDFHFEYTECDSKGGRWRVQVPKPNTCEGGAPRPPIRGKSCDFTCDKGQYLDLTNDQECKSCPPGTYSLGDGERFEEWNTIPDGFTSSAETFSRGYGLRDDQTTKDNCTNKMFMPKGSYISALPGNCNSQLTYSATLVKTGSVYFEYQFASEVSALFHFTIQNEQCESSYDKSESHAYQWPKTTKNGQWGRLRTELKRGLNVLKWRVIGMTQSSRRNRNIPVLIKKIEIRGIGFTSVCTKCRNGTYSSGGTNTCAPCPINTYSDFGAQTCIPCDSTSEYSMKGAGACIKRPACTKEDYYQYQLPCDKGKTQINYMWIRPQICRTDLTNSVSLPPKSAPVDCPPCNPGMYSSGDSGCEFCVEGTYSDGKAECQNCPASTSPNYQLQYNWWNTMPLNMTSECALFSDDECEYNSSWIPMSDHLETHYGRDEDAYLLLIQHVSGFRTPESRDKKQVVGSVSFVFSTTCEKNCAFVFLVESAGHSIVQKSWEGSQGKTHYKLDIQKSGPVAFSWAFQRTYRENSIIGKPYIAKSDTAKIYSITVTNSLDGGAVACTKCPKGMVNDRCVPCPAGHYIDLNTTTCATCPHNTIIRSANLWGKENCEACGQGLMPSADGTECVNDCTFIDGAGRLYDFKNLNKIKFVKGSNLFTGSGTKYYHGFNVSLCGGDKTVTCSQNVTSEETYGKSSINQLSYVPPVKGVICRSTFIPSSSAQKPLSTQPTSLGDYITKIVSNQSLKEIYEKGGFESEGSEKDIQFYSKSESSTEACPLGRSTIISLKCDKNLDGEGEILVPPKCIYGTCDGCNFHFLWKTMYACPKCGKTDFNRIVGECSDGSQSILYTKPDHCLGETPAVETRKCAIKFPFIVKVVVPPVVILGIILLICVLYCWQRNKSLEYKYMKLVHGNEPNYDGELPGVDSCALSDGEEDQFDSVQFKESRGSKLLNKLRGKRSKDDENPFETGTSEKIPLT